MVLEDLSRHRREELEGLYDRDSPRQSWSGNEALGAPKGWLDADLDLWEQKFGPPPFGEASTVHLSAGTFASCRIDRVGVAALSGCQDGLVALCEIPPDEREGFAKASADHFVLTAPAADPLARPEIEPGAISSASVEEREAIARALDRLLPDAVSRVREARVGTVEVHRNNDPDGGTDDMASLTRAYTDEAIQFIERNRDRPFFLYLAHTMVHSVIDASPEFKTEGTSLYDATIQELDHHTGRLLDTLDELGLRDDTLVLFASDNGAWNTMQERLRERHGGEVAWGSSGPLRSGEGSSYEGGLRVPLIVRWPGHVPANRVTDAITASIDFMPTLATIAGYDVPTCPTTACSTASIRRSSGLEPTRPARVTTTTTSSRSSFKLFEKEIGS